MTLHSSQGTRHPNAPRTKIFRDLENPYHVESQAPSAPEPVIRNEDLEGGWSVPLTLKFDKCSNEITRIGVLSTINEELHNAGLQTTFVKNTETNDVSISILSAQSHHQPSNGDSLHDTFKNIVLDTCQKSFSVDSISQNGRKVTFFQNEGNLHFLDAPAYEM